MKAMKGQLTNQRTVTCKCPQDHNRKQEHGVSLKKGQGYLVQVGNTYMFYCKECFTKHSKAINDTVQTVGQDLTSKAIIKGGYQHQVAFSIATKDTESINRLKRNGYNITLQGKTIIKVISPFIANLNGLGKQFDSMHLTDRKVTIISKNESNDHIITKGRLSTVVKDCQKARLELK